MAKKKRLIRLSLKKIVQIEKQKKLERDFGNKKIGFMELFDGESNIVVKIYDAIIENERKYGNGVFFKNRWYYFENGLTWELDKTKYSKVVKNSDFFS